MNIDALGKEYFTCFSNKDLDGLAELFSEDVTLRDWEAEFVGKEAVLDANKNIFESVQSIQVEITSMILQDQAIAAEIIVNINEGETKLLVVDLLEFTNDGKIKSVKAYRGN